MFKSSMKTNALVLTERRSPRGLLWALVASCALVPLAHAKPVVAWMGTSVEVAPVSDKFIGTQFATESVLGANRISMNVQRGAEEVVVVAEAPLGPFAHVTEIPVRVFASHPTLTGTVDVEICAEKNCEIILSTVRVAIRPNFSDPVESVVALGANRLSIRVDGKKNSGNYGRRINHQAAEWVVALAGTTSQDLLSARLTTDPPATNRTYSALRGVKAGDRFNDYPFLVDAFHAVFFPPEARIDPPLMVKLQEFARAGGIVVTESISAPAELEASDFSRIVVQGELYKSGTSNIVKLPSRVLAIKATNYGDGHWLIVDKRIDGNHLAAGLLSVDPMLSTQRHSPTSLIATAASIAGYQFHSAAAASGLAGLWMVFAIVSFAIIRKRGWRTAVVSLGAMSLVATGTFFVASTIWHSDADSVSVRLVRTVAGKTTSTEWGTSSKRVSKWSSQAQLWVPSDSAFSMTRQRDVGTTTIESRDKSVVTIRSSEENEIQVHWMRRVANAPSMAMETARKDYQRVTTLKNMTSDTFAFMGVLGDTGMVWRSNVAPQESISAAYNQVNTDALDGGISMESLAAARRLARELGNNCTNTRTLRAHGFVCAIGVDNTDPKNIVVYQIIGFDEEAK